MRRALDVVAACGLPAVVSSALDTSVGMAAGVALAAALPELPFACGLGTVALLEGDTARPSLVPERGHLPVRRVSADSALLERWAAPEDRRAGGSSGWPRAGPLPASPGRSARLTTGRPGTRAIQSTS